MNRLKVSKSCFSSSLARLDSFGYSVFGALSYLRRHLKKSMIARPTVRIMKIKLRQMKKLWSNGEIEPIFA
jgi:hypothetical protein